MSDSPTGRHPWNLSLILLAIFAVLANLPTGLSVVVLGTSREQRDRGGREALLLCGSSVTLDLLQTLVACHRHDHQRRATGVGEAPRRGFSKAVCHALVG